MLNLELRVTAEGGHGSTPPEHTAIGVLSAAIARLEDEPMPASIQEPLRATFEFAGPEMRWPLRLVATNLWLFEPVLTRVLAAKSKTATSVRTTTAVTMIGGGVKINALPRQAWARIDHRINAGDTSEEVIAHVREVIDDPRVEIEVLGAREVSRISSGGGPAFEALARALREAHPTVVVAPGMNVAASDARYYEAVARDLYRISPFFLTEAEGDVERYHGVDERLPVEVYGSMIQFYGRLMQTP